MSLGGKRKCDRLEGLESSVTKWADLAEKRRGHQAHARELGKEMKRLENLLSIEMVGLGLNEIRVSETQMLRLESCIKLN